ncbi:MAG: glycoside hydrolase family 3 N-terminal domain-containing protein [Rhodoferax sp.]
MNNISTTTGIVALAATVALLSTMAGCDGYASTTPEQELQGIVAGMTLEEKLAQKFVVDFRYFCTQPTEACSTAFTQMQPEVGAFIKRQQLGGVILFSNNIQSVAQTVQLTDDIQKAAFAGRLGMGYLITTDQEGGTVLRTPRDSSTRFTGNMSIGASHAQNGTQYAGHVGGILGSELAALGINVNHAPVLDVNINPNNPVINVRSFSDSPDMVARLGLALQAAIQSQGIGSTVKHFPGHGDTQVDSHYGLPLVNHDLATIRSVDLYPFQYAFDRSPPDMVMTAHIQYPALDSSMVAASTPAYIGQSMMRPATLSRAILTNLLRDDMHYQGVIITDAMNMAGIAAFFSAEDAVLQTFAAGTDLALMPIGLSTGAGLQAFDRLLQFVLQAVRSGALRESEIDASVLRILKLKKKLGLLNAPATPVQSRIEAALQTVGNPAHRQLERELAEHSVTLIKNGDGVRRTLPLDVRALQRITVLASKENQGNALKNSLRLAAAEQGNTSLQVNVFLTSTLDRVAVNDDLSRSQLLIIANDANKVTPVETGAVAARNLMPNAELSMYERAMAVLQGSGSLAVGEETSAPLAQLKAQVLSRTDQEKVMVMIGSLQAAKALNVPTVFVSLAAPYETAVFAPYSDSVIAAYNGNTYTNAQALEVGVSYQALSRLIFGMFRPTGHLPINIPDVDGKTVLFARGHGLTLNVLAGEPTQLP